MNQTSNSRDDLNDFLQTAALLSDLHRMRGSLCSDCKAPLCNHETLMSLVVGYQDAPRCLPCLARAMDQGWEEVRDYLLGYIMNRPCRRAGWLWANREEGAQPAELPSCLWPTPAVTLKDLKSMTISPDSPAPNLVPDAEWDAGDMGCGELVMGLRTRLQPMTPGQILKLIATDAGMPEDLPAWCRLTGHKLVFCNHPEYWIQRREN